jgi:hypothetical protein
MSGGSGLILQISHSPSLFHSILSETMYSLYRLNRSKHLMLMVNPIGVLLNPMFSHPGGRVTNKNSPLFLKEKKMHAVTPLYFLN